MPATVTAAPTAALGAVWREPPRAGSRLAVEEVLDAVEPADVTAALVRS